MALHDPEEDRRRKAGESLPTPAEGLTKDSSDEEIQRAVSATISKLVDEGFPQEQAQAIALEQARRATGKESGQRQSGVRRAS